MGLQRTSQPSSVAIQRCDVTELSLSIVAKSSCLLAKVWHSGQPDMSAVSICVSSLAAFVCLSGVDQHFCTCLQLHEHLPL